MQEIWKPVVGYESVYEVSNTGRVKRISVATNTYVNRILKPRQMNKTGYYYVNLSYQNKSKSICVHVLVAEAFLGKRKKGFVVNHINNKRTDNNLDNLEWVTHGENIRLGFASLGGRKADCGENHAKAKLKNSDVLKIRELHATGKYTNVQLGRMFGVDARTISQIHLRQHWKHI